jgi:ATP-binding cassette subfamily B protein
LKASKRLLIRNSALQSRLQQALIKALQEGLGAIRDVLLDGSQAFYVGLYQKSDRRLWRILATNNLVSIVPRYVMEAIGLLIIATLAYSVAKQPGGLVDAIPALGAFALGAQRLLPVLQQIYSGVAAIRSHKSALEGVLGLLAQPLPRTSRTHGPRVLSLREGVRLHAVSFRYFLAGPVILDDIMLEIKRGARVGIVGATGSGKSTLLDILMGLLPPSSGTVLIDGAPLYNMEGTDLAQDWRAMIAHVPQSIFLADVSIAENIALGVPRNLINKDRLIVAASQACVDEFVQKMPLGYETLVGERGVRLSGGQRQRLGIARALYKQAAFIVFDEATSALDGETETEVMAAINNLSSDLTLVIVAHRRSTLKNCDQIIEVKNGRIEQLGSYAALATRNESQTRLS